jgi:HAE1 family hydrophobic/amphiphilic exporter-1
MINKKFVSEVKIRIETGVQISEVQSKVDALVRDLLENDSVISAMNVGTISNNGFAQQMSDTYSSLGIALAVGLLLIYLVMVAIFQSFVMPAIILICIPLAFTGSFIGLAICGMPLSIPALIGFLVLMGVIVNNGILAVDYTNQARRDGLKVKEALVASMHTRARPIFMTALTTILALLPTALGWSLFGDGSGTGLMQPVAVVSIFGLLFGTMTTLLVVPAFYAIFCKDKKEKVHIG